MATSGDGWWDFSGQALFTNELRHLPTFRLIHTYHQYKSYNNKHPPRHITHFGVNALRVSNKDTVLDPACGTGGFLVAAFDHVRKDCDEEELEEFKKSGLYGIEQEPEVVALALVNMIFRGDGKNNIMEGNCFADKNFKTVKLPQQSWGLLGNRFASPAGRPFHHQTESGVLFGLIKMTRVLMNPPFALKKEDEKEYKFIDYALSKMTRGGLCL